MIKNIKNFKNSTNPQPKKKIKKNLINKKRKLKLNLYVYTVRYLKNDVNKKLNNSNIEIKINKKLLKI